MLCDPCLLFQTSWATMPIATPIVKMAKGRRAVRDIFCNLRKNEKCCQNLNLVCGTRFFCNLSKGPVLALPYISSTWTPNTSNILAQNYTLIIRNNQPPTPQKISPGSNKLPNKRGQLASSKKIISFGDSLNLIWHLGAYLAGLHCQIFQLVPFILHFLWTQNCQTKLKQNWTKKN